MEPIIHKSIEQKSDAWFALRGKKMITSSDMAMFFGLNGEAARQHHFAEKAGAIPNFWGNDATAWGNYAEPLAAADITKLYSGCKAASLDFDVGFVEPDSSKRLHGIVGSSPDGIKTTEFDITHNVHVRTRTAVEIKCPYSLKVPAVSKIPWSYILQCYQHMYCMGVDKCLLFYWVPYFANGHTSRLRMFVIYADANWVDFYEERAFKLYHMYWSRGIKPPRSELYVDQHRKLLKSGLEILDHGWFYPEERLPEALEPFDVAADTASDDESEPEH